MYVDVAKIKGKNKVYTRTLLRTSYWDKGKVKHKTIANLSSCTKEEVAAIKFALKNKKNWNGEIKFSNKMTQGLSIGAVFALKEIAKRVGIKQVLTNNKEGTLALWQIIARIIGQGSRLSAVRLGMQHAVCDILNVDNFNEEDLYANLDWIADNQEQIEDALFREKQSQRAVDLFLYDVTSSYCEGIKNELAEYGYSRDGKKGKKQIVIGLLTDVEGDPVSVEVYRGNTNDHKTFLNQVKKSANRFQIKRVIFVGDGGMIKNENIENLPQDFFYITAITKPQIRKLINEEVLQYELFDINIGEIEKQGVRYIFRKNPTRAKEIECSKRSKLKKVSELVMKKNKFLERSKRAKVDIALKHIQEKLKQLNIDTWVSAEFQERKIILRYNEEKLKKLSKLDGCYAIKTNVPKDMPSEIIHERYKDLAGVEQAFRTMKTGHLEVHPYYVRKEERTKAHVFIVMLGYKIIRYLKNAWRDFNITVEEGIRELSSICSMQMEDNCQVIPEPRSLSIKLLKTLKIILPEVLPSKGVKLATRKKLQKAK